MYRTNLENITGEKYILMGSCRFLYNCIISELRKLRPWSDSRNCPYAYIEEIPEPMGPTNLRYLIFRDTQHIIIWNVEPYSKQHCIYDLNRFSDEELEEMLCLSK